jgi:hypothetical protein
MFSLDYYFENAFTFGGLTLYMPGLGVLLNTIVHGQLWHKLNYFLFSQT